MPKEDDICKRLDFVTGNLSTQFRTLAIGLIAVCGGLLIGDSKTSLVIPMWVRTRLIGAAMGAIVALAVDLLQFVFGYVVASNALQKLEEMKKEGDYANLSVDYEEKSWSFRSQMFSFWAKLIILVTLTAWMAIFMSYFLLHPVGSPPAAVSR